MDKAIILHGTKGSPESNWFRSIALELGNLGCETIIPSMPTPDGQSLTSWTTCFENVVGSLGPNSIVIGHSLGAVFALRLLESTQQPIKLAVIVAGFTGQLGIPEYDKLNATFIDTPFQWETIRNNAGKFICISGDNDPYVPLSHGHLIANELRTELIIIEGGGHLNAEFGYQTFPLLVELISSEI